MFFSRISLTGNSDSIVSDGRCQQDTAQRAFNTCHTRTFSRVHVAQDDVSCVVVFVCRKSHSIPSMCHRTSLDAPFPHHSPHRFFLNLHPVRRLIFRCSILRRVHPLPLCKQGCALAARLKNPLSQLSPSQRARNSTKPTNQSWSNQLLLRSLNLATKASTSKV